MRKRQNWIRMLLFLVAASLFLVACERPLPGGYNDPAADGDGDVPDVPVTVPEVDSDAYPAEAPSASDAAPAGTEAYPAEAVVPADGYPADGASAPAENTPLDQDGEAQEPAAEEPLEPTEAPADDGTTDDAVTEDATAESAETVPGEIPDTHTVAEGENLYRIGLLYGIDWLELAEANDISDPDNLSVGQVLTLPKPTPESEVADADSESAEAEPAGEEVTDGTAEEATDSADTETTSTPSEDDGQELPTTYIVQAGDNLFRIGVNFGVDWNEIVAANGIVNNYIYPGQELIIPAPAGSESSTEEATDDSEETVPAASEETEEETTEEVEEEVYVVQEGDTIYSVAFVNGITWTALVEANGLESPYALEVGQQLILPAAGE